MAYPRPVEQPVEEEAATSRSASVETECELIQVVVQMLRGRGALVGADNPTLEQADNQVNVGQGDVWVATGPDADRLVVIAGCCKPHVAAPGVGEDGGARLDRLLDEGNESRCGHIGDATHPHSTESAALSLGSDHHDRLIPGMAATDPTLFHAAYIGLIDLNFPAQVISARPDHGSAQLVQPDPCRLVAAQAEHSLKPERADPVLLIGDLLALPRYAGQVS